MGRGPGESVVHGPRTSSLRHCKVLQTRVLTLLNKSRQDLQFLAECAYVMPSSKMSLKSKNIIFVFF